MPHCLGVNFGMTLMRGIWRQWILSLILLFMCFQTTVVVVDKITDRATAAIAFSPFSPLNCMGHALLPLPHIIDRNMRQIPKKRVFKKSCDNGVTAHWPAYGVLVTVTRSLHCCRCHKPKYPFSVHPFILGRKGGSLLLNIVYRCWEI